MAQPSKKAREELETQILRVNNKTSAKRAWERLLREQDRKALGGKLEKAFTDHRGLVGMWAKLRKMSGERAVIELAQLLGFISQQTQDWLLREYGEKPAKRAYKADIPDWDKDRRELRFNGDLARKVPQPKKAFNVVMVLDAFQELGWPPRIDDPMPGGKNTQRLHKTIQSLNKVLKLIAFRADGTGAGFEWYRKKSDGRRTG